MVVYWKELRTWRFRSISLAEENEKGEAGEGLGRPFRRNEVGGATTPVRHDHYPTRGERRADDVMKWRIMMWKEAVQDVVKGGNQLRMVEIPHREFGSGRQRQTVYNIDGACKEREQASNA